MRFKIAFGFVCFLALVVLVVIANDIWHAPKIGTNTKDNVVRQWAVRWNEIALALASERDFDLVFPKNIGELLLGRSRGNRDDEDAI